MRGNGKSYTANVDIPALDGVGDVKAGQTFTGLDQGVADFLVGKGDIAEGSARTIGAEAAHVSEPAAISGMSRNAMLAELATTDDALLREAVEEHRRRKTRDAEDVEAERARQADADKAPPKAEPTKAEAFADRNLSAISDAELSGLSAEDRADVRAAEVAGRNRQTLLDRIDALDKPPPGSEPGAFDAAAFAGRNLDDISADELAALTPEQRAAVRAAEEGKGEDQARKGLLERLDALDKPAGD